MMENEVIKGILKDLDNLCFRLQQDYGVGKSFEQCEEDRLAVYNIIEIVETLKMFVEYQVNTYPCNDTLETILDILNCRISIEEIKEKYFLEESGK